ncbi:MAG: class I SAM-dependent methyltransferase [Sphingomonadales bacterium]
MIHVKSNASIARVPDLGPHQEACLLCGQVGAETFFECHGRAYARCTRCGLRFLNPRHHPAAAAERAHYLLHENDPADPHYRHFLSKLARPLLQRLAPAREGLDYGCGPGPALAAMLREAGHAMALYDPFFQPDPAALERCYDFITCTETAEHFHRPAAEFQRLMALVRPGGWLAVMTCFQTDDARFKNWHYRQDPTHVVFYRAESFRYLATTHGWDCEIPVKDVALLQKPI